MAITGNIFQVTDHYRLDGQDMLNVYFYHNESGDGTAEDLAGAFQGEIVANVRGIMSTDVQSLGFDIISLFDEADNFSVPLSLNGLIAVESFPRVVAVNFTLRPSSRAVRPGHKRYSGLPEDCSDHNVFNDASWLVAAEDLRTALATTLNQVGGLDEDYIPVVVKRIKEGTPPGPFTYRLPANASEANVYPVIAALLNIDVSHQVTRD